MSTNTMLTNVSTFDVSNMIFSEPVTGSIPDLRLNICRQ